MALFLWHSALSVKKQEAGKFLNFCFIKNFNLQISPQPFIIYDFRLIVIRSSSEFDPDKFHAYCMDTKKLWIEKGYNFYPLTPTVHRIIEHGHLYMKNAPVPLGLLNEEPLEAHNKDYRFNRLHLARKFSRKVNLNDSFMRSYNKSDPVIAEIILKSRKKSNEKKQELPDELKALLK